MDEGRAAAFQFAGQDIPWLLASWAESQPDKTFLIWEPKDGTNRTWTYAQFWSDVRDLAAGLVAKGVSVDDKVLIHADNCPEMVLAWYACATVGAVGVTTNTRSVRAELEFFIQKTRCVGTITQPQYAGLVAEAGPALGWTVVTEDNSGEAAPAEQLDYGGDRFDSLVGDGASFELRDPDPMAPVGILFTSGTTSQPKAVVHTHANALWAGKVGPTNISMERDDTYLVFLPFFHVNAQSWSFWTTLGVGGTIVLQPKFSSSRLWEVILKHKVTHISLIPFVYNAVAGNPIPEHTVKVGVFGLIVPELEQWLGFRVVPAYGMTETVIHVTNDNPGRQVPKGSMGKPTPGYELLVVDRDTGEVCEDGRPGELWVRGTRGIQLFLEYYDNSEAMAKSFTTDGWFKTGDVVRVAEGGNFVYCDRDGDVLKVGGENVSAREVEDACRQVPGVGDVAVVAQSHEMLSEVAVAFVIKGPMAEADDAVFEKAIIERCASVLADFKVPRAVYVVDEFPRATLDKVAKNKLREQADALVGPG
ncbi:MAG: class I adenylate-forming enzyme family protein [Acidimicrobiales bacterium]